MTGIKTFAEAEATLASYVPLSKQITGKNLTLARMKPLMEVVGDPQQRLKVIHVAGTSGKTSTSYYIAALLSAAGLAAGLTVSPHVDSVTERLQFNGKPITEAEFTNALDGFISLINKFRIEPTYFELLVGLAYWYFNHKQTDYVVAETGLGGLQDATNVAQRQDKVCVITDIGFDHMHILGHTIPEIAQQKAGIIHPGNQVFMYEQSHEVMEVFKAVCEEKGAVLNILQEAHLRATAPVGLGKLPAFQQRNWLLARAIFSYVQQRDGLGMPELEPTMHITIPGRMEKIRVGDKAIILDGAHNEQKIQAFVSSFSQQYPGSKVPVLLSLRQGKEFNSVLPLLKPITSKLIITEFSAAQDLPANAINAEELARVAQKLGLREVIAQPDQELAYQLLLTEPGALAVVVGSFYLLGQLRHNHKELHL